MLATARRWMRKPEQLWFLMHFILSVKPFLLNVKMPRRPTETLLSPSDRLAESLNIYLKQGRRDALIGKLGQQRPVARSCEEAQRETMEGNVFSIRAGGEAGCLYLLAAALLWGETCLRGWQHNLSLSRRTYTNWVKTKPIYHSDLFTLCINIYLPRYLDVSASYTLWPHSGKQQEMADVLVCLLYFILNS